MKLLVLLLLAVSSAAGVGSGNFGLTFKLVEKWVDGLEHGFYETVDEVSDLNTLSQVGQERLNNIYDHFLPQARLVNTQQDELTESVRKQMKALQHTVDELQAHETGVTFLAESTRDIIANQRSDYFTGNDSQITGANNDQDTEISGLQTDVKDFKQEFLDNLAANISSLEMEQQNLTDQVYSIRTFVANRKCEYGHGFLDLNTVNKVNFKTKFNTVPSMTATLNGLFVHLDNPDHAKGNGYAAYLLGKFTVTLYPDYFLVVAGELTTGQLRGKVISCVWMACEGLE